MRDAIRNPLLWLALLVGTFVRIVPVVSSDFPLNDGGLFASIVDQLVAGGMRLPEHLTYNGADIPFAYPPAALYLGAGLVSLGLPTLDVLHFIPVLFAILLVPAWYFLARELVDERIAGIAAVIYAVVPKSFEWLISGGGLTRSLGLLLTVLALIGAVRYFRSGSRASLLAGGILLGAAALTHPEAAVFGAGTACLFAWRERAGFRRLFALALISTVIVAPWVFRVLAEYGPGPMLGASASRAGTYYVFVAGEVLSLALTREAYVALGALLGIVGLFVAATSGRGWLLAWILVAFVLTPAASPTFIMLPLSAAAAIAVVDFVVPRLSQRARQVVLPAGLGVMVLSSIWAPHLADDALSSVPSQSRQFMTWASAELPAGSSVAIVSGVPWGRDAVAEWFPYLTGLRSVGTPQGTEFSERWRAVLATHDAMMACATKTADCLQEALGEHAPDVRIVVVPKAGVSGSPLADCCRALRETMRASAEVLYDGEGATIFGIPRGNPAPTE